jgi:hypothetical protein
MQFQRGQRPFVHTRWTIAGLVLAALATSAIWRTAAVHGQIAVRNQGFIPYSDEPIHYRGQDLDDPVARLQQRLDAGTAHLEWNEKGGYLQSVLRDLHVPVSSQTLVFSKTSFQYKKISPQAPRALYFNDDVYVGFVKNGRVLEVISFDPHKGAIFYLLQAEKHDHPVFERAELDCTQCHIAEGTRGVPGVLVRSVYPTITGTQAEYTASYVTGQESPFEERWDGWYVTGTYGDKRNMGNATVTDEDHPEKLDTAASANITTLKGRFDGSPYLSDDSDIVAHLVLAHQTQMHNLITLAGFQQRIAAYDAEHKDADNSAAQAEAKLKWEKSTDELLRYLLFANEAHLDGPVKGTSSFAHDFTALGPRDRKGRSLRDFELETRIFRYPCSYLIYSEDWDALPAEVRTYVYRNLYQVLTDRDQSVDFERLGREERRAILEILLDTKPDLPAEWRQNKNEEQHARLEIEKSRAAHGSR